MSTQCLTFDITKSKVDKYSFLGKDNTYVADIILEDQGKNNRIYIVADFGSAEYSWPAPGPSFRKFLASLNIEYLADKLNQNKVLDMEATCKEYVDLSEQFIAQTEMYTKIQGEISWLYSCLGEGEFIQAVRDSPNILKMYDGTPQLVYRINPLFQLFWDNIWPLLIHEFRKEDPLDIKFLADDHNTDKIFDTAIVLNKRLHFEPVKWIAKTGGGNDWCIYYGPADKDLEWIKEQGEKVTMPDLTNELVPCTEEALKRYRY